MIKTAVRKLPIRLVFLDEWVAGDQVAGNGSRLHTSHAAPVTRQSHGDQERVRSLLLGDERLYFRRELDILQRRAEGPRADQ